MTDNEIIKALEYCKDCSANLNVEIIDLITRQQAEIERLQKEVNLVSIQFQDLQEETDEIKSEAYKEFANKLEEEYGIFTPLGVNWIEEVKAVRVSDIDKILKEMVGEE